MGSACVLKGRLTCALVEYQTTLSVFFLSLKNSFLAYLTAAPPTPSLGMTQLHFCSKGYFTLAIRKDMDLVCGCSHLVSRGKKKASVSPVKCRNCKCQLYLLGTQTPDIYFSISHFCVTLWTVGIMHSRIRCYRSRSDENLL